MRIYLDNCCYNRPFDDQTQARVRLETEAKLEIQQRVKDGKLELAWSYILDFENQANPFEERRSSIGAWQGAAAIDVEETPEVLQHAQQIAARGLRPKDALHVACAIVGGCGFFLTTDDKIIRKMRGFAEIAVMNPTQFVVEVE